MLWLATEHLISHNVTTGPPLFSATFILCARASLYASHCGYAGDFLILVKSLRAAQRVMQSITRFIEVRLRLVVNRQKSRAARLLDCTFLGFQMRFRSKIF